MFSTIAIIISLFLLMYFAYRGYSVLILAPLMATLAVALSGDILSALPIYTTVFMKALSGFLLKFFPIFCWARCLVSSWQILGLPQRLPERWLAN